MPSNVKTTKEFPIIAKYYYIMDFTKMMKPQLIPLYFLNRNAAKRAIKENNSTHKAKIYSIFHGESLLNSDFPYVLKNGRWGKFTKYKYEPNLTKQEKKNIRTMARRRLRRMNLYTNIKARRLYNSAPQYVKQIKNTQKVSNSPGTSAKCFQLERETPHRFYIILGKKKHKSAVFLISLKVLSINLKTGNYSYKWKNIHKTDILIPFILREAYDRIKVLPTKIEIIKSLKQRDIHFINTKIMKVINKKHKAIIEGFGDEKEIVLNDTGEETDVVREVILGGDDDMNEKIVELSKEIQENNLKAFTVKKMSQKEGDTFDITLQYLV